jgi:sugar fermentation stimulation protein A
MPLLEFETLQEGVLIKRYKRFLADIELSNGELVTAHCANTGPMTGVLIPGQRVRLRHAPSPKRKLAWTWEQAEVPGADGQPCWAGINTALPNRLIEPPSKLDAYRSSWEPSATFVLRSPMEQTVEAALIYC